MSKYPNSGILARNKRKENDRHPDHTGQCEIDGVEYWVSAWVKDGREGKFFSLSFKPKEAQQKLKSYEDDARTIERFKSETERQFGKGETREKRAGYPELDDSIPF